VRWRCGLIVLLLGLMLWVRWSDLAGARWYPTRKATMRRMLELARVGPGDVVFDLGSGDARILVLAAEEFGARGVGIEVDPIRHAIAARRVSRAGLADSIVLVRGDFFSADIAGADVVTLYLRQHTNDALAEKLAAELAPGTLVASNTYTLPGLPLKAADESLRVYVYEIPAAT
jgi:predicted O-methyltransferase YrrM